MNLKSAFELLGVEPGCTVKQARRAYLRLLRRYKPDRDPEGFQRLREAYELVRSVADSGTAQLVMIDGKQTLVINGSAVGIEIEDPEAPPEEESAAEPVLHEPETDEQVPDEMGASAEAEANRADDERPAAPPPVQERDSDSSLDTSPENPLPEEAPAVDTAATVEEPVNPLAPFLGQLRELDTEDPEAPVRIARAATETLPDNPEAHRLLAVLAQRAGLDREACKALRRAIELGSSACFDQLLQNYAPDLTVDELTRAAESQNPGRLLLAALEQLSRGRTDETERLVLKVFELTGTRAEALPVAGIIEAILGLLAARALQSAEALAQRLESWLDVHGSYKTLDDEAAIAWKLIGELRTLPEPFPHPVRATIANGIAESQLSEIPERLSMYATEFPQAGREASEMLERAPTLRQLYGAALGTPLAASAPQGSKLSSSPSTLQHILLRILTRLLLLGLLIYAAGESCPSRDRPNPVVSSFEPAAGHPPDRSAPR
ncbi:MAG: hypothetical protein AAF560_12750 [Acidobacteriota bacterium]